MAMPAPSQLIDVAVRRKPADVAIRGGRVFNLITGELLTADVALVGNRIAAVGNDYHGKNEIDARGLTLTPGLTDAHCHIESSLVRPCAWEEAVLRRGVVNAVCDPHELANVCGIPAIEYFRQCAARMILHLQVQIPSCVPALPSEQAGAHLPAADIAPYASAGCALAELMNVPGVLGKDPDTLAKAAAFHKHPIDGHAPGVSPDAINALAAIGVTNDHECSSVAEAVTKLRLGWTLFLRLGSVGRDLKALTSLFSPTLCDRLCLCTDDADPLNIVERGHLDAAVRLAIEAGCDPLAVYRAACLTPARHFGWRNRGLIAPGYAADLLLMPDLAECRAERVFCSGQEVTEARLAERPPEPDYSAFLHTVHGREWNAQDFIPPPPGAVIGVRDGQLLTDVLDWEAAQDDLAIGALIERHGHSGQIGRAWVHGFGLRRGALASTVGHDSHNLCVVGASAADMALAANAVRACGGGFAVACEGTVTACLPLPLGGLMSTGSVAEAADALATLRQAARETGTPLSSPFLSLAFLPLPVIPAARLTLSGYTSVSL